ncbi:TonB family protein [Pendulispora albinea]|uniref:Energy transducer TonB n=1 Tax=Pendulispora albinea TaxID=2741071 RepID=A0ABZ2LW08_9BACT
MIEQRGTMPVGMRHVAEDGEPSWFGSACAAASIILHIGVAFALQHGGHDEAPAPRIVELTMTEAPPPPPPPPPPKVDEPEPPKPKPVPVPEKVRVQQPVKEVPPEAPPPQMTGRTLTDPGEGDKSWSSLTGNGQEMKGPLVVNPQGSPTGTGTAPAPPAPPAPPPGPRFVAVGDLSRAPRPPNLDDALERNYPKSARMQGIGGTAVLRAQILPDGRIGVVRRTSESFAGFGEACERTLRSANWSPPIDRAGLPVGTEITYTCRFDVRE